MATLPLIKAGHQEIDPCAQNLEPYDYDVLPVSILQLCKTVLISAVIAVCLKCRRRALTDVLNPKKKLNYRSENSRKNAIIRDYTRVKIGKHNQNQAVIWHLPKIS